MTILKFKKNSFEESVISSIPESWKRDSERVKNTQLDIHRYMLNCLSHLESKKDLYDSLVVALCLEIKFLREISKKVGNEPTPEWLIQVHTKLDEPSVREP